MTVQHRLEKRAQMLGQKMRDATESLAKQLGAGERPPFTEALTRSEAVAWWRAHRHDEFGKKVLERMQPWDIARLDAELGAAIEAERGIVVGGADAAGG